ncbi:MAG: hypothetical protein CL712_02815 [Chloroflexi bacterium]|nr:hypothetical protein [Chloroflexota bacterium]
MSIEANSIIKILKSHSFSNITGVPDSTFGNLFNLLEDDKEINYIRANREDTALGISSGFSISNNNSCVVMQNSGVGNIINPITSFNLMYQIPVLLIVGWRGYGGKPNDAPEHWIMGEKTKDFFKMLNISTATFENVDDDPKELGDKFSNEIDDYLSKKEMKAIIIKKGVIT